MRRLELIALVLLFTSCFYRPVLVEGRPPNPSGLPTRTSSPQVPARGVAVCNEISRRRCDTAHCKGNHYDYVTLRCSSGDLTRCEISKTPCNP
jgi:hypothetical protein